MNNQGKLTHGQTACLTYASAVGNIVYSFTFVTSIAGRASWVAVLIGVLLNIPFAMWILSLAKSLPGKTIFDLLETGLGKFVCKLIILFYLLVNVAIAVCMMNMSTGMIRVFFLPETPTLIIMLFFVFLCTIFVRSGIFTLGRLIQVLVVLYTLNFFLGYSVSFIKTFKLEYVLPIFDTSVLSFAKGVIITAGTVAESLMFLMLMVGSISHTAKQHRSVKRGIFIWSLVLSFAIIIMEGDMGHEMLYRVAQAGVTVARIIEINSFVRGLEILILMTYQYLAIAKITIYIYCNDESLIKLFNIKKGWLPLTAAALLIFAPSVWINSLNAGYYFSVFLGSYVILPFVLLVLILASVSALRIRKRNEAAK
ncbi:hypothetical protein SDC9_51619 [bioreactor metagenome]|uniref:Spore germination protein YndE n=1 Tax=bioreactor metagenome TaxID=1076179 RepID=A0A644WPA2_9ZZZZ